MSIEPDASPEAIEMLERAERHAAIAQRFRWLKYVSAPIVFGLLFADLSGHWRNPVWVHLIGFIVCGTAVIAGLYHELKASKYVEDAILTRKE